MQQLLIRVSAADADRVSGLLFDLGVCGLEERSEPEGACFVIYSDERAWLESVQAGFEAALSSGPALTESVRFEHGELSDDYDRAWLDHLGPEWLTPEILIHPVSVRTDLGAKSVIVYKPDVAFGTGSHPTTRLAAEAVARAAQEIGGTLLDVGTGNGVLAFVAVMTGCSSALGIDVEDGAVAAARVNADLNGLAARTHFTGAPLAETADRFDIVVANIDAPTLRTLSGPLCERARQRLIVTGLLVEQQADVEMAFLRRGMQRHSFVEYEDWCLLEFVPGNA